MDLSILDNLNNKATLITPSRRLAASLRQSLHQSMLSTQTVSATIPVFALEDWKVALWEQFEIEGLVNVLLLNQMQALLRFEQIIMTSDSGKGLLRQHQAAKSAIQAWDLIHHWQCEDIINQSGNNTNEEAFNEWARSFHQWLKENQFIDNTLLTQHLIPLIKNNDDVVAGISPAKVIHLYGFEELSPLTIHFFESLKADDWEISHIDISGVDPKTCFRVPFNQKEAQFYAAANWAKIATQKNQTVGIVVPNLADERAVLDKVFRDVFTPNHILNPSLEICSDFNISAATPLIQYPIIYEAINLIKFALLDCSVDDNSKAVTSVFTSGALSEQFARAQLADTIKTNQEDKINLKQTFSLIKKYPERCVPALEQSITSLLKLSKTQTLIQSVSHWMQSFKEILSIMGWPGERTLTSNEYQLVKRMDELFNEMMLCDSVLDKPGAFEAISLLQKMAANVPFQAENKGARIQILGLIEAIGQTFDNCWIMGMDSEAWPPMPTPNPFIPIEMQRTLNMPHASAQRELAYASSITKRFKESAEHIIFSYTLKDKEKNLNFSELIEDLPLMSDNLSIAITRCETTFMETDTLETLYDEKAPPLTDFDTFKGTATTLSLQAICPFKAFGEQRLKLKQMEEKSIWLNPSQQGNILHDVLEDFWNHFKSLDNVNNTKESDVSIYVQNIIEKNLRRYVSSLAPATYLSCEKNRLCHIVMDYIDLEKTRMPFKVLATEQKLNMTLANIQFSIRLDRVDVNHLGDHVIIDYKTGQYGFTAGVWQERLETPQLPLYYISSGQYNPKAVAVIKLNSKKCEYEGVSESPSDMVGVNTLDNVKVQDKPASWDALQSYWLSRLTFLADEFTSGNAAVLPLYRDTCQYCHLSSLCRINEVQS